MSYPLVKMDVDVFTDGIGRTVIFREDGCDLLHMDARGAVVQLYMSAGFLVSFAQEILRHYDAKATP